MTISSRKLKNGKTKYDVVVYVGRDASGRRLREFGSFDTLADAKLHEARLISQRSAMNGKPSNITLSDYIDKIYWPDAKRRLSPTSLDTYERIIRKRIKPHLGECAMKRIDHRMVQDMVDDSETAGIAKQTVATLKTILNHAIAHDALTRNVACGQYAMPREKGSKRDNGLVLASFGEIYQLLDIVSEKGSQCVQRIAYTGLLQGMRPQERYALTWEDINVHARTISIDKAFVVATQRNGGHVLKGTKTETSTRVIPMHPRFYEWIQAQPRGRSVFIVGADGKRISPSTARHRWQKFLRENPSAAPVTIENMRHSFATSYLHAGGNIEDLSRILGHADISTTFRNYVRPSFDNLRIGMEKTAVGDEIADEALVSQLKDLIARVRFSAPPPFT